MNNPEPHLWRYDYEDQHGKMVPIRSNEVYAWAPVNTKTGQVEMCDLRRYDDSLEKLAEDWEWCRFTLIPSPPPPPPTLGWCSGNEFMIQDPNPTDYPELEAFCDWLYENADKIPHDLETLKERIMHWGPKEREKTMARDVAKLVADGALPRPTPNPVGGG